MTMSRQEAGRMGGKKLASDPQKKSEASRKAAASQDMAAKGKKGGEASRKGSE